MTTKITILYENRSDNCQLQEGWGFSAFIEHNQTKLLFDTGGDWTAFSHNASTMNLPYESVTHLLFSHKHWDHIAGFKEVIDRLNPQTKLFLPKAFPRKLLKQATSHIKQVEVISSFSQIAPEAYSIVFHCKEGFRLYEQVLVLKTARGLGIITGCAHPGIISIIQRVQKQFQTDEIAFVLGGFHELFTPPRKTKDIVKQFQTLNVKSVAPCHCSGDHIIRQFKDAYGSNFLKVGTGSVIAL